MKFTVFGRLLLVILNEVEVCPLFAALRVFCHTQYIRNMHATWRVARPRNAVIYDVSRFFVNYSVAWPRNRPCCVHVAYVLRMTKPTQRCEGAKFEMFVNIVTFSLVYALQ